MAQIRVLLQVVRQVFQVDYLLVESGPLRIEDELVIGIPGEGEGDVKAVVVIDPPVLLAGGDTPALKPAPDPILEALRRTGTAPASAEDRQQKK